MCRCIVLPTIFAGIAIAQFLLACATFAALIYFVIRDYLELQHRRQQRAGNSAWRHSAAFTSGVPYLAVGARSTVYYVNQSLSQLTSISGNAAHKTSRIEETQTCLQTDRKKNVKMEPRTAKE